MITGAPPCEDCGRVLVYGFEQAGIIYWFHPSDYRAQEDHTPMPDPWWEPS